MSEEYKRSAIDLIAAERRRQVEVEGFTAEHDDGHHVHDLRRAAACYALPPQYRIITDNKFTFRLIDHLWPWEAEWWKPKQADPLSDNIRDLVKAGALIVAEIERLQRRKEKVNR
jgi:hypothetical protein